MVAGRQRQEMPWVRSKAQQPGMDLETGGDDVIGIDWQHECGARGVRIEELKDRVKMLEGELRRETNERILAQHALAESEKLCERWKTTCNHERHVDKVERQKREILMEDLKARLDGALRKAQHVLFHLREEIREHGNYEISADKEKVKAHHAGQATAYKHACQHVGEIVSELVGTAKEEA